MRRRAKRRASPAHVSRGMFGAFAAFRCPADFLLDELAELPEHLAKTIERCRLNRNGELTSTLSQIVGKAITIECEEERVRPVNSEVNQLLCNNQKAKELIKWQPTIKLVEGLTRTVDWFKKNQQAYKSNLYNI